MPRHASPLLCVSETKELSPSLTHRRADQAILISKRLLMTQLTFSLSSLGAIESQVFCEPTDWNGLDWIQQKMKMTGQSGFVFYFFGQVDRLIVNFGAKKLATGIKVVFLEEKAVRAKM